MNERHTSGLLLSLARMDEIPDLGLQTLVFMPSQGMLLLAGRTPECNGRCSCARPVMAQRVPDVPSRRLSRSTSPRDRAHSYDFASLDPLKPRTIVAVEPELPATRYSPTATCAAFKGKPHEVCRRHRARRKSGVDGLIDGFATTAPSRDRICRTMESCGRLTRIQHSGVEGLAPPW